MIRISVTDHYTLPQPSSSLSCPIGGIVAIATTTTVIVVVGNVLNALLSAQLTFCKTPLFCGTFSRLEERARVVGLKATSV